MAKASPAIRTSKLPPPAAGRDWQWLTDGGLVLAMALAAARMMMSEPLKQGLATPLPGSTAAPLGPGPATGLILDLLCWLPAFAVLLRRLLDSRYTLRRTGAFAVMAGLGLWAVASMAWSADKFTSIVDAFGLLSAMILLWAAAQSVRSWIHLRLVAGVCAGLLAVLAVKGYTDRLIDQPMMRANWESQKESVLREHHWTADSPEFHQFQLRVLSGQAMGFSQSPNTYAGLLVLLGTVTAGLILDRMFIPLTRESRGPPAPDEGRKVLEYQATTNYSIRVGWTLALPALIGIVVPLIVWTQCRTAYVTPILTVALLAIIGRNRRWLAEHAKSAFIGAAAMIAAGFATVIGVGLIRGNLIHSSLTFRWWYWIGSARLIARHPRLGVGWGNFGQHYLAVRLPIASEEIIDPHNFLMRFFTELGLVGGVLVLTWLVWTAWKMTAGSADRWEESAAEARGPRWGWIYSIVAVPMAAIVINFLASVDFGQSGDFLTLEATNRFFWLAAFVVGMAIALVRRKPARRGEIAFEREDSPGPWTVRAMQVGLGIFLIHNLIEFGIFEPGPMVLVALLCGTLLGLRIRAGVCDPGLSVRETRRPGSQPPALIGALIVGAVAWLAAAAMLVTPIAMAEGDAETGDALIRTNDPAGALAAMESAARWCPYNAAYPVQAADAAMLCRPPDVAGAIRLLQRAAAIDPLDLDPLLTRAALELQPPVSPASAESAITDYRQALAIDPNNVRLRLQLADLLKSLGQNAAAADEYQKALQLNAALESGDPKRLSQQEIEQAEHSLMH